MRKNLVSSVLTKSLSPWKGMNRIKKSVSQLPLGSEAQALLWLSKM